MKDMEILALYVMPIAKFNASEFVDYGQSLFNGQIKLEQATKNIGHKTSLENYNNTTKANAYPLANSEPLKKFICECAEQLTVTFGYDIALYKPSVKNIWLNEMVSGGSHALHNHYGSNYSGTFYVDVPENSGTISFDTLLTRFDKPSLDIKEFTQFNSNEWTLHPKQGDLFIWESHVKHQVKPTKYKGKRRSIAFDVIMEYKN
jgi:uncharacterized protein (TIGR02466 family)